MPNYNLQLIGFVLFVAGLYWVFTRLSHRPYGSSRNQGVSLSEIAMIAICVILILAALLWR